MRAIRAVHAFDGTRFVTGGVTVVLDGERIVGVHAGRVEIPEGTRSPSGPAPCCPGWSTATPTW